MSGEPALLTGTRTQSLGVTLLDALQDATQMPQAATRPATRFRQNATRRTHAEWLRTVAVLIGDAVARERVLNAIADEGLSARVVTTKDFGVRGLDGPPAVALVY